MIVCRNPLVAAQRARKREQLLAATETDLAEIAKRVQNATLSGSDQIGLENDACAGASASHRYHVLAVGPAVKRYRMRKHFQLQTTDTTFTYERKLQQIATEAALDGFYILRTGLATETLADEDVVRAYKNLEQAERAFGSFKGPDLQIRPIYHHLGDRVCTHVLICMLAYYLTWHLKAAWKPLLFIDEDRPTNPDPVAKALRSPGAQHKAQAKRTTTGEPAHSYRHPARRARDPDAQHHPPGRLHRDLQQADPADPPASPRPRARRQRPCHDVDTTETRRQAPKPSRAFAAGSNLYRGCPSAGDRVFRLLMFGVWVRRIGEVPVVG